MSSVEACVSENQPSWSCSSTAAFATPVPRAQVPHHELELGIGDDPEEGRGGYLGLDTQLFAQLALKASRRQLTGLDVASRDVPPVGAYGAVRAVVAQEYAVLIDEQGADPNLGPAGPSSARPGGHPVAEFDADRIGRLTVGTLDYLP